MCTAAKTTIVEAVHSVAAFLLWSECTTLSGDGEELPAFPVDFEQTRRTLGSVSPTHSRYECYPEYQGSVLEHTTVNFEVNIWTLGPGREVIAPPHRLDRYALVGGSGGLHISFGKSE